MQMLIQFSFSKARCRVLASAKAKRVITVTTSGRTRTVLEYNSANVEGFNPSQARAIKPSRSSH